MHSAAPAGTVGVPVVAWLLAGAVTPLLPGDWVTVTVLDGDAVPLPYEQAAARDATEAASGAASARRTE